MKPTVSDRIALAPDGRVELAHGRIERREHLVARIDPGAGQPVEQGRLAGVGVADQRHHRIGHPAAGLAVQAARALHAGQLLLDPDDALGDPAPVELELALAGPPRKPKPPRCRSRWVQERTSRER